MKTVKCDPQLLQKNITDKKYFVTGANSGVGLETTKQLVKQGAHVVMGCRRVDSGKKEMEGITGPESWEVMALDLGDLSSVRACADAFLANHDKMDALVNNAGLVAMERSETKDGFETQIGVNHFSHFLFTDLLLGVLKDSVPSRIVILPSCVHEGL